MKLFKQAWLALLGCALLGAPVQAAETGQIPPQEKVKAAFLFNSPVGDGGWIYGHNEARKKLDQLPYVDTTFVENVPESDGYRYINDFARKGYNLIITCSFGYMQDTATLSAKYPNVAFEHCAGYTTTSNMGNFFGRNFDGAYLVGMAAGGATKSNTIGYVASFPIAEVVRNINAFAMGVKHTNPDAKVKVVWISTWYDPALEREGAESLIAMGADVISNYQNSPAILQTAEKHGVYATGQHSDMTHFAPKAHIASSVWNWDVVYKHFAEMLHKGNWKPEELWWGMEEGLVDITPLGDMVPANVQTIVQDYRSRMKKGDETARPFYDEVKDQKGIVRIPAGRSASKEEILTMNYLVDNVEGELPAN